MQQRVGMARSTLVEITGISPFLFFVDLLFFQETIAGKQIQPSLSKLAIRKYNGKNI